MFAHDRSNETKWVLIVYIRSSIKHDQCSTCRISVHLCQSSLLVQLEFVNDRQSHIRASLRSLIELKFFLRTIIHEIELSGSIEERKRDSWDLKRWLDQILVCRNFNAYFHFTLLLYDMEYVCTEERIIHNGGRIGFLMAIFFIIVRYCSKREERYALFIRNEITG